MEINVNWFVFISKIEFWCSNISFWCRNVGDPVLISSAFTIILYFNNLITLLQVCKLVIRCLEMEPWFLGSFQLSSPNDKVWCVRFVVHVVLCRYCIIMHCSKLKVFWYQRWEREIQNTSSSISSSKQKIKNKNKKIKKLKLRVF